MPMTITAPTFEEPKFRPHEWTVVAPIQRSVRRSRAGQATPALLDGVPVWEITTARNKILYIERCHYLGYRPCGTSDSFQLGSARVHVFPLARSTGTIHRASEDYQVPDTWYEPDVIDPTLGI